MSDNVRTIPGRGTEDVTAVLEVAKSANLRDVMVIGFDEDDALYMASNMKTMSRIYWLVSMSADCILGQATVED